MRTRAAVLREPGGALAVEDVELDAPRAGEVLVQIAGTGLCHTDLLAAAGGLGLPLPVVLGHEGAGTVLEVGEDVRAVAAGDVVVLSFDHCGTCPTCRRGRPAYCEHFGSLNHAGRRTDGSTTLSQGEAPVHGSFLGQSSLAAHALAGERNAVPVRTALDPALLGPLGCSLQTGAGAVLEVLGPEPGDGLVVVGLGAVGLAALMAGAALGCTPLVGVDPDARRRELALELGATHALDPGDGTAREVRRLSGGGVAHSVEAVGSQDAVDLAVAVLRSPGTCATLGFRGPVNRLTFDQGRLLFGRTLTGVIEGDVDPRGFIPRLLELQAAGRFPFERLVSRFALDDLDAAVEAVRRGDVVKPVLVP